MTGNVVYVCTDEAGASCKQCGAVTENVLRKQWTVVYCGEGDGIEGNAVKVAATNSYLQIAEIEIYVEGKLRERKEYQNMVIVLVDASSGVHAKLPLVLTSKVFSSWQPKIVFSRRFSNFKKEPDLHYPVSLMNR